LRRGIPGRRRPSGSRPKLTVRTQERPAMFPRYTSLESRRRNWTGGSARNSTEIEVCSLPYEALLLKYLFQGERT
jgi:hypothetical protein